MAIQVVLDYPRQHAVGQVWRTARVLAGSVLLLAGLVAVPIVVVVSHILLARSNAASQGASTEQGDTRLAWLVLGVSVLGPLVGVRLIRGARRLVLFLRRFGYSDASRAVTFAAVGTMGRSWRVVTLDDAAISPVDVPSGTKRLFRMGGTAAGAVGLPVIWIWTAALTVFWLAVAGMAGIAGLRAWHHTSVADLFRSLGSKQPAHGDVEVFQILLAVGAIALGAFFLLAAVAFFAYLVFAGGFHVLASASRSLREAEQSSRATIETSQQLRTVTRSVLKKARRIFSPRLVVVRVASDLWRRTVQQLASRAAVILIDVSEPTQNLLWEIQNVLPEFGPRCVFVGHYDRVCRFATNGSNVAPHGLAAQLASLLDGREVLAYTNDEQGMRQFARALRAKLEVARAG